MEFSLSPPVFFYRILILVAIFAVLSVLWWSVPPWWADSLSQRLGMSNQTVFSMLWVFCIKTLLIAFIGGYSRRGIRRFLQSYPIAIAVREGKLLLRMKDNANTMIPSHATIKSYIGDCFMVVRLPDHSIYGKYLFISPESLSAESFRILRIKMLG